MTASKFSKELQAIQTVLEALEPLDEAQRKFVIRTVGDRLGMATLLDVPGRLDARSDTRSDQAPAGERADGGAIRTATQDPAKFMVQKKPGTDIERITCLAFLLKQTGTRIFGTRDLSKMNTQAAGNDFSNASFASRNAFNAGFLAKAGGGKKQITPLGEMVVEALPDAAKVKAVIDEHRPKRRKSNRKSSSGKK